MVTTRTMLAKEYGSLVRARRKELGMTGEELARATGLKAVETIRRIEAGKNFPEPETQVLIAQVLERRPLQMLSDAALAADKRALRLLEGGLDKQTPKKRGRRSTGSAGKSSSAHSIPNLHKRPPNPQPLRPKFSIPPVTKVALAGSNA